MIEHVGPLPDDTSEADLIRNYIEFAHLLGWKIAHFRPAMTKHGWVTPVQADGKGWPDVFAIHPASGDRFAAELKSRHGRVSDEQRAWARWMLNGHIEHHIWRPRDWPEMVMRLGL